MDVLRTPDERFVALPGYPFEPHYVEVASPDGSPVRIHYLDEGPAPCPRCSISRGECYRRALSRLVASS